MWRKWYVTILRSRDGIREWQLPWRHSVSELTLSMAHYPPLHRRAFLIECLSHRAAPQEFWCSYTHHYTVHSVSARNLPRTRTRGRSPFSIHGSMAVLLTPAPFTLPASCMTPLGDKEQHARPQPTNIQAIHGWPTRCFSLCWLLPLSDKGPRRTTASELGELSLDVSRCGLRAGELVTLRGEGGGVLPKIAIPILSRIGGVDGGI
jgi:hypothetical protein